MPLPIGSRVSSLLYKELGSTVLTAGRLPEPSQYLPLVEQRNLLSGERHVHTLGACISQVLCHVTDS